MQADGAFFRTKLIDLIRARHAVLLVESHEAERVTAEIERVALASELKRPRRVTHFTLSKGLHAAGERGKPLSAQEGLAAAMDAADPTIFVFHDLHHFLGAGGRPAEPGVVRAVLDVAARFRTGDVPHTLVIVAPTLTLPVDLEKAVTVVDLPLPGPAEIDGVLEEIVAANQNSITVALSAEERHRLVQAAQGLTLGEAENAFARAIASDKVLDAEDIKLVLDEKRQTIRKSGLLEFIAPSRTLDDVGGLDNLKRWLLKRNGAWLGEAAAWGVPAPKGVLITGVPGCGKSLTATCIASAWELPLLRLDVGKIFAGLVGSSEQNMRKALSLAEAVSPSILWIDEIEKGFGTGAGDSGTSGRVLGTFLTWMQEKASNVFVIATANKIDGLPPEFLRKGRFDEVFFVDLPTRSERADIWKLHIESRLRSGPKAAGAFTLDKPAVDELAAATDGFSGAEIAEAVISACFDAFADRRAVVLADFARAVRNTVPLSVTQAEQISAVRDWAATRAVAATPPETVVPLSPVLVTHSNQSPRGGRTIEF
ncbi:AAA family ATPase [Curtobacterium flaccumfaciens]|uniref:AAA family ATPase n=1 Tax=Curtobacterium flaccumfaciens TaxID=2035 RepID=UPI0021760ECC|nr:AAA family ATPase [Curtobacterium flaccumfaciens]MCS5493396.1 AAA family ATPase [Curtobacterium flaccumfaciens pv. flaccumfaciens]